jgi:hypothetical protein
MTIKLTDGQLSLLEFYEKLRTEFGASPDDAIAFIQMERNFGDLSDPEFDPLREILAKKRREKRREQKHTRMGRKDR